VPSTPVDAELDLSDPDLIADHLPLDEFAWLRRNQPVRWNPQPAAAGYGDGGYWALTRHADVTAVTRAAGWSVEAKSSFVRRRDENDPTGESTKHLLLCMDPPRHTRVRKVGNRCFTPRALAGLEDDLRERAQRIVWAAKRSGSEQRGVRGGAHFCPGANLSRLALKVMFDVLADELSDAELTGPPGRLRSSWLNGIKHLPVSYGGNP
jgi:cytochrome P450